MQAPDIFARSSTKQPFPDTSRTCCPARAMSSLSEVKLGRRSPANAVEAKKNQKKARAFHIKSKTVSPRNDWAGGLKKKLAA